MAKRRLSKQQKRRIASNQQNRITDNDLQLDESSTMSARVISHHGKELFAETDDLQRIKCNIRQNLGDIACGDYVQIQQAVSNISSTSINEPDSETAPETYVVVAIRERKNLMVKTGFAGAVKPVAANIDQLVIVTAVTPKPNPYLIDRYLTTAENLPADALIIINKVDLADSESEQLVADLTGLYEGIGYQVLTTSVKRPSHIEELSQALSDKSSILVGLSGVGKSSLVKALLPRQDIKIGETSQATGEGKHTTTVSALYHLKHNGIIIDSPGVRDFTPINQSIDEITNGFKEIRLFAGDCKFTNCSHQNEPGCALKQAVTDNRVSERRFNNFKRLVSEFEESIRE